MTETTSSGLKPKPSYCITLSCRAPIESGVLALAFLISTMGLAGLAQEGLAQESTSITRQRTFSPAQETKRSIPQGVQATNIADLQTQTTLATRLPVTVEPGLPEFSLIWESRPNRSYLIPALEVPTYVFLLNQYDRHFMDPESEYRSTGNTIWNNLTDSKWVVDNDQFSVNQFLHLMVEPCISVWPDQRA